MARIGIDRQTGGVLTGWAHCAQSIAVIWSTMLNTLLFARDFGSNVPGLVDRPMSGRSIADVYVAGVEALRRDEPGFRPTRVSLVRAGADGVATFEIAGDFYPNGHLGDYSVKETVSTAVPWPAATALGTVMVPA